MSFHLPINVVTNPLLSFGLHLLSQFLGVAVHDTVAASPLKLAGFSFIARRSLAMMILDGDPLLSLLNASELIISVEVTCLWVSPAFGVLRADCLVLKSELRSSSPSDSSNPSSLASFVTSWLSLRQGKISYERERIATKGLA